MQGPDSVEVEKRKQLVGMLATHQRRIQAYVHTLVPNVHDAEDIFQDTCEVVCEKFDEFRAGTDFAAWACRIAWWRVRAARTDYARAKTLFNEHVLELLSDTAGAMRAEVDSRQDALAECMKKLPARDRSLVLTRYEAGESVETAAEKSGRSLVAAYKALARIRKSLLTCVNHRLAGEAPA